MVAFQNGYLCPFFCDQKYAAEGCKWGGRAQYADKLQGFFQSDAAGHMDEHPFLGEQGVEGGARAVEIRYGAIPFAYYAGMFPGCFGK